MLRVRVLPGLYAGTGVREYPFGEYAVPVRRVRRAERGTFDGRRGMRKIILFFQESFAELKKVTWPSRDEATASTRVVLVSVIIIAAILGLVDFVLFKFVDWMF